MTMAKKGAMLALMTALLVLIGTLPATAGNGSVTYTYDALGRLISAYYDTGVLISYSYDANGNRTQEVVNVYTPGLWGSFTWGAAPW